MKRFLVLLMAIVMVLSLVACNNSKLPTEKDNTTTTDDSGSKEEAKPTEAADKQELKLADTLEINFSVGNNQRTMTYNQSTPMTMPDGSVIAQGALKPTWQYISSQIGVELKDVAVQDQEASEMIEIAAATGFDGATIYGGAQGTDYMNYGPQGYLLDLSTKLNDMPNVKAFLEASPNIAASITAYDGGIYYLPYVAEIGNYARGYHGRETWVVGLLDSTDALETETHTLNVKYEGYWNRNATNVIALQNAAASNGVLTRDEALNTLINYINETYPLLEKPSDLYLGETAQYDIDELVALWRVIELSPNTLSKLSTGKVVEGAEISPYFVRVSKYREDLLRLANYFGGQRVHGTDSYGARFYLNADGELVYSYNEDGMLEFYDYLSQMYSEGLIHTEFADLNTKDDFRKVFYASDANEGQKQFGFMTFDWFASTTASNPDVVAMLPPVTTVDSDQFIHYIENTRTIKPEGWAISTASSEEEINAALTLFDYMFSENGHVVQNYGVPDMVVDGETFAGPDGNEYPKFEQWVFDTANQFTNGDVSALLRDFIGSQFPIGYQKEIGFEYQYTINRGWDAWALYNNAGVVTPSYEAENPLYQLIPSVFSLTDQDLAKLSMISVDETLVDQIFLYISGSDIAVKSTADIKKLFSDAGIDTFIQVYKEAYKRMTE